MDIGTLTVYGDSMTERPFIPFRNAILTLAGYARSRIVEQAKLVAFIVVYLVAFQVLVLRVPLDNALSIAAGIGMVIVGLALFLEGLLLALMPLGEKVGLKLPVRTGIFPICGFGLLLGFGSTLAEPGISALRVAGTTVTAWDAPLLFLLLERHTDGLVLSIGAGVGIAVFFGMIRFYYGISIRPFVMLIIPPLLGASMYMSQDPNLSSILGLAWDAGAVTTGAVTVPLVLALGIGVSRASPRGKGSRSGFGVIMLASAFPVLGVMVFGYSVRSQAPEPVTEAVFFSEAYREQSKKLFSTEAELLRHAFTRGSEIGRRACFADDSGYRRKLTKYAENPKAFQHLLGDMTISTWLARQASESERMVITQTAPRLAEPLVEFPFYRMLLREGRLALQAVLPLSALLLIVLMVFLRDRPKYLDETLLGLVFTVVGLTLLTSGIHTGLAQLGSEVGTRLPIAFKTDDQFVDFVRIENFDPEVVSDAIDADGRTHGFFYLKQTDGYQRVEYLPENFNAAQKTYQHFITRPPMFGPGLTILGIGLVLLFAFGMGFGSTLAEPALNAMGITVEEMTVGTITRGQILVAVSIGVGLGLMVGVGRIMYDIPLIWLMIPPYLAAMVFTFLCDEEFAAIAWDCGGVTTGQVTVPLVLAMGLSVGRELNAPDGFGILALASVFPILTVLVFGYQKQKQQMASLAEVSEP